MKRSLLFPILCATVFPLAAQTPISEMGTNVYQGYQGGLYPGGSNVPPTKHRLAAAKAAVKVKPLDRTGIESMHGAIGVISIGMSNTTQEFRALERAQDLSPTRNGSVVFINGAKSAVTAERWSNPTDPIWPELDARISSAGLSAEQVQVAWVKLAQAEPLLSFPQHAELLRDQIAQTMRHAKARFPNLRLAFLSNRIYGGYTSNPKRGEPLSFETGFAVKWLIEQQISGDPTLNHAAHLGTVTAPVLLWANDLWANGSTPRPDGLTWLPEDYEADFIHPSNLGEQKIAELWANTMAASPAIKPWLKEHGCQQTIIALPAEADAFVSARQPDSNFGAHTELRVRGGSQPLYSFLRFRLPALNQTVVRAHVTGYTVEGLTAQAFRTSADFDEKDVTFRNAPVSTGAASASVSQASNASSWRIDVTSLVNQAGTSPLVLMLSSENSAGQSISSREGHGGPLLVLTLEKDAQKPCP